MLPQPNPNHPQPSIQQTLSKISNSLIFSSEPATSQQLSQLTYFQKYILLKLPQIVYAIIKSHLLFLKQQLNNHRNAIDQIGIQVILDGNQSITIFQQLIRYCQKMINIDLNQNGNENENKDQQNKIIILIDILEFKKILTNNVITIYKNMDINFTGDVKMYQERLEQQLYIQIQIKIQQIFVKISQIINWLLAYIYIKNSISSEAESQYEYEYEQYKKIINIFIQQAQYIGNKIKNDQLHNYYLTKLLKNKGNMNWSQQFIQEWLANKKQIIKIQKQNNQNNMCGYLDNKIGCLLRKSIQWLKCEGSLWNKQQRIEKKDQLIRYDEPKRNIQRQSIKQIDIKIQKYGSSLLNQNKNEQKIVSPQKQLQSNYLSSLQFRQQRKQTEIHQPPLPKLASSISIKSDGSENNKFYLTKQQKDKKINQYFPKRLNLLNHIQKNFIFQKSHSNSIVQVVKQISNGQKLFMKYIIKQLIKRARFNNVRYDNQMFGDQFKYYNSQNEKLNEQFSRKLNKIDKILKNTKLNELKKNSDDRIYYKLTYPSKLQGFFGLKYGEQQQEQKIFTQLKKINQFQKSSQNTESYGKKLPQQIAKYICEDMSKDKTEIFRQSQLIKTKRLKITVNMIKEVLLEKCEWIFAAQKSFYRW